MARLLLEAGADPNRSSLYHSSPVNLFPEGEKALDAAHGSFAPKETIDLLLAHGARSGFKDPSKPDAKVSAMSGK